MEQSVARVQRQGLGSVVYSHPHWGPWNPSAPSKPARPHSGACRGRRRGIKRPQHPSGQEGSQRDAPGSPCLPDSQPSAARWFPARHRHHRQHAKDCATSSLSGPSPSSTKSLALRGVTEENSGQHRGPTNTQRAKLLPKCTPKAT